MIQSSTSEQAKKYFSDALSKADYYLDDQELQGRFTGSLAARLGILGPADKETFYKLCDNVNPVTGDNLTLRTREERTVGYDINFHCPKSLSIIHALSNDNHIIECFENAVNATLKDIEADSKTRVRKGGKDENRNSGELIIAQFTHQTARPVAEMLPDVHIHQHAFVFNCAYDPVEKIIKAGQFRDTKKDMPYYQAKFHKRLSDNLIDLGYDIRVTDSAFEVAGVPDIVIKHMSKRTNEIGQYAKQHGITDPEMLSTLGARTRSKKQKGLSMAELKKEWREQIKERLTFSETEMRTAIRFDKNLKEPSIMMKDCIDNSIEHSFERASVMAERRLLANTIKHSIGERHISINALEGAVNIDQRLINVRQGNYNYYTTKNVLAEEREMVRMARKGQGRFKPLYQDPPFISFDGQQGAAIKELLTSSDQMTIMRGVAGAGKTTSLIELDKHIRSAGKETFFVAPMANTAREQMPNEGFKNTETVAKLLSDRKLQEKLKGQVLIVDEAGQLGTKDMSALLRIADTQSCRLICVGDTRQHNAVLRGDALRIVNTIGGVPAAEVNKIYRQRSNREYLAAVEDLSKGDVETGFEKLDAMGAIKTVDPLNPNKQIVRDYLDARKDGKSVLVISPTRKQGRAVSEEIRKELRNIGKISKKDLTAIKLENLNYSEAEKSDWRKYRPGQIVQFSQNVPGINRGSIWQLVDTNENTVTVKGQENQTKTLPLERGNAFNVYDKNEITIAKGDKIRITQGGFDIRDKRLNNGQSMDVEKVSKDGVIHLRNSTSKSTYKINKSFGHIDYDYCSTSHSAQGKTVDVVLISQPAETFNATDAKQFYVSCSRGKRQIAVYTDDKEKLVEHASRLGDRTSAMELVGDGFDNDQIIRMEIEKQYSKNLETPIKENFEPAYQYREGYEPRL